MRYDPRAAYYERMNMSESPYGHIKHNIKIRQFLLRGIKKVKAEARLIGIGFNIMKIHKYLKVNI